MTVALLSKLSSSAFPEYDHFEYWIVENTGWTDIEHPSWFECNHKFKTEEEAATFAAAWMKKHPGIRCRIAYVTKAKTYSYMLEVE